MSYIPSDFDNLNGGFNILNIVENSSSLPTYEGSYADKGLGYKQQYSLYGDLSYPMSTDPTHLTMDFCYIFKDGYELYPNTNLTFKLNVYGGEGEGNVLQSINLTSYNKTITQDSDGNEVWLYEDFDLTDLTILNNLSSDTIFCVSFYTGFTNTSSAYIREYNDLCSFNRDGIFSVLQNEMPIVIKWLTQPIINFRIERKDPVSDKMLVSFEGTFDNSYLGTRYNTIAQITLYYYNPLTQQEDYIDLIEGTDYILSGNVVYSGSGSSMEQIEINLTQVIMEAIEFRLFVATPVNYTSAYDEVFDSYPVFNWGKNTNKFLNVNGDLLINNTSIFDLIYPIGSIYMSVNSTSPATLFGGSWTQIEDTFLLSAGSTYTAGDTGGEATVTLSSTQIPAHTHRMQLIYNGTSGGDFFGIKNTSYQVYKSSGSSKGVFGATDSNSNSGGSHNNMPPYLVVYAWKRTA